MSKVDDDVRIFRCICVSTAYFFFIIEKKMRSESMLFRKVREKKDLGEHERAVSGSNYYFIE